MLIIEIEGRGFHLWFDKSCKNNIGKLINILLYSYSENKYLI